MSPVNWVGSVSDSETSPHHSFLFRFVHVRRRVSPVPEVSFFATEISITGLEIFPYEHYSLLPGWNLKDRVLFISVAQLTFSILTVTGLINGLKSQLGKLG